MYLAVFEDKAETSGDRLERTEGICRVSHPTKEQLGRGGCVRLPVRFVLLRRSARLSALVGMKNFWYVVRDGRGFCVVGPI